MLRTWTRLAACVLAVAAVWACSPQSALAQFNSGELYFAHGLPGDALDTEQLDVPNTLPVDVCVGIQGTNTLNCVFSNVTFSNFRGPLDVTPGVYQVVVSPANQNNPGSNPAIITGTVAIRARQSFTFVAHVAAGGGPKGTSFLNDTSRIASTKSRVTVRQTAALGAVDVALVSPLGLPGTAALGLVNGTQSSANEVMAGPFLATMTPDGKPGTILLGPQLTTLSPLNAYFVYAVGSPDSDTVQFLVQRVSLGRKLLP
ncbi:DUF4397 domain-containing protein [bacterium]|nr:DUF4397 domain-containing protein [bacterium]